MMAPQTSENFAALGIFVRERKENSACSAELCPGSPITALGMFHFTRAAKTHKPVKICALGIPLSESLRAGVSCSLSLTGPGQIALGIPNAQTSENLALSEFVRSPNKTENSESDLGNRRIRGRSLNSLSHKPSIPRAIGNFHSFVEKYESSRSLNLAGALGKKLRERFFFTRLWGH